MTGIGDEYLRCVIEDFKNMKKLGDKTIERLDLQELHWSPDPESNSIAIIVKHLRGNMLSRWTDFLHSDGEKPYRNRDDEFIGSFSSKTEVIEAWEEGWDVLFEALESLSADDLQKTVYIRGEAHSVIKAIQRQIAHYSNHIGQIIYIGKWLKKDKWESLSIPKGQSQLFLQQKLNNL
jgi:Protein of unknown function (DUF1572)